MKTGEMCLKLKRKKKYKKLIVFHYAQWILHPDGAEHHAAPKQVDSVMRKKTQSRCRCLQYFVTVVINSNMPYRNPGDFDLSRINCGIWPSCRYSILVMNLSHLSSLALSISAIPLMATLFRYGFAALCVMDWWLMRQLGIC